jgi:hypothetical protein
MPDRYNKSVDLRAAILALSLAAVGCTDDSSGATPTADGSVGDDAGATDAGPRNDAARDGESDPHSDAEVGIDANVVDAADGSASLADASQDGDGAADASTSDAAVDIPTLLTARASQVGRFGGNLRIDVTALRGPNDTVALSVELFNSVGAAIGSTLQVPLDAPIELAQGAASATISGLFARNAELSGVRVRLVDDERVVSESLTVTIDRQPTLLADASCDPAFVQNRCAEGLGCKGTGEAKTCQPGEAPVLARAGYYDDALGPRIIFEGTDGDADVISYRIRFLDGEGDAVFIDDDSFDGTGPVDRVTASMSPQTSSVFFALRVPSEVLLQQVASIAVTVLDSNDTPSNEILATKGPAPLRGLESECDARGFTLCSDNASCSNFGDQHRCALPSVAQQSACEAAMVLNPAAGMTRVRGSLRSSLWDPPAGCSTPQASQPDRVVKLVLANAASRVVLSTDHAYTSFDSALYLLTACTEAPLLSTCSDDQPPPLSSPLAVLTLTDLAAGEYYVVVDSLLSGLLAGDTFELTATLE